MLNCLARINEIRHRGIPTQPLSSWLLPYWFTPAAVKQASLLATVTVTTDLYNTSSQGKPPSSLTFTDTPLMNTEWNIERQQTSTYLTLTDSVGVDLTQASTLQPMPCRPHSLLIPSTSESSSTTKHHKWQ